MALRSYSVLDILLPTIISIMQECSQALNICKCLWSLSCGGVSNMLLFLSITFAITLYGVVCVQHSSLGDHHQIGSIKRTIVIFSVALCLMFATSYSVTYCIYVPGKPGFCFHQYCAVNDEYKYLDTFWLADSVRLFVHYSISLSSFWKLIWRHWIYKMPARYILSSVWVR